jgi:hypothetical protein
MPWPERFHTTPPIHFTSFLTFYNAAVAPTLRSTKAVKSASLQQTGSQQGQIGKLFGSSCTVVELHRPPVFFAITGWLALIATL